MRYLKILFNTNLYAILTKAVVNELVLRYLRDAAFMTTVDLFLGGNFAYIR